MSHCGLKSATVSVFTPWKLANNINQYSPHPHWKRLTNDQYILLRFISYSSKYFPNTLTCYFRKKALQSTCTLAKCSSAWKKRARKPSAAAQSPGKWSLTWRSTCPSRTWHCVLAILANLQVMKLLGWRCSSCHCPLSSLLGANRREWECGHWVSIHSSC